MRRAIIEGFLVTGVLFGLLGGTMAYRQESAPHPLSAWITGFLVAARDFLVFGLLGAGVAALSEAIRQRLKPRR
jgi:hypothetical protein